MVGLAISIIGNGSVLLLPAIKIPIYGDFFVHCDPNLEANRFTDFSAKATSPA